MGSCGPTGLVEKDLTLQIARRVRALLGGCAQLTRDSDVNRTLLERAGVASRSASPAFVSIHVGDGRETYVHDRAAAGSVRLAQSIDRELARVEPGRPGVLRGDLAVLVPEAHHPATAACLVEVGSLSDYRIGNPETIETIARAIAQGLHTYGTGGRAAVALDQGIPNLSFGRDNMGAPSLLSISPLATQPTGIGWTAYNETDAEAGPYTDLISIERQEGSGWMVEHRAGVRNDDGVRARSSATQTFMYAFPSEGVYRVRVQLNHGAAPIPEGSVDDNEAVTPPFRVWPAPRIGSMSRFGDGLVGGTQVPQVPDRRTRVYSGATRLGTLDNVSVSFDFDEVFVVLSGSQWTDNGGVVVTLTDDQGNNQPYLCRYSVEVYGETSVVLRFSGFPARPDGTRMRSCKASVDNTRDRGQSNLGVEVWT